MPIYRHVPVSVISNFLSQYRAGYDDKYFGCTLMHYKDQVKELPTTMAAEFAHTQLTENPEVYWNIAFIGGSGQQVSTVRFRWKEIERTSIYEKEQNLFAINGKKMRLASKTDILKVANVVSPIPVPKTVEGSERNYYLTKYFGNSPILMLYSVHVKQPKGQIHPKFVPAAGSGLLAAKIVIPSDDITDKQGRGKVYYYNTVASRAQYQSLNNLAEEDDEG